MRNRSTSPLQYYQQQSQPQPKKYYSRDQVSSILRDIMQAKLSTIYKQLEDKQQLIKSLNEKLNKNDNQLQNSTRLIYQLGDEYAKFSNIHLDNTIELVNKVLDQKFKGYWENIQRQLDKIKTECHDSIHKFHQNLHEKVGKMLGQIKKNCFQNVQNFKKKNNAYWVKVKQALNKINNRTVQSQQKITAIGIQINKYQLQRQQNSKAFKQIQNCPNTAKLLVQLKKSVNNVYKNFQQVLKLQQKIRQSYQGTGSIDKWTSANPQSHFNNRNSQNLRNNRKPTNRQQQIVILQYSIEDDTASNHQLQISKDNNQLNQHSNNPNRPSSRSSSIQQYGRSMSLMKKKSNDQLYPLSPITGKIFESSNLSHTQVLLTSDKNKNGQTALTNSSIKNQTLQWGDNQFFYEQKNDHSGSFQLITTNGLNSNYVTNGNNSRLVVNPNNQVSTSMLNFSLQCRKEMIQSIRPRLIEMIETKGMSKPIKAFMDQINYLKNEEGNYLFDLKGNMFKLTPKEFSQLQKDNIIQNIKTVRQSKKSSRVLQ